MIHPLLSIQARTQSWILKHFAHTPYGRYMASLRNAHLGESCFIIGNGPSLTVEDLTMLWQQGIHTFGVNRIYQIFSQTPWRPTYYVNTDHVLIRDKMAEVEAIPAQIKFFSLQDKYYHGTKIRGGKYFFRNDLREKDQPGGFSLDCTNQINIRGTVTIDCMQLSMHMGYKRIYLLGVDHNFDKIITENGEVQIDPSVKNYFIEGYDADVSSEVVHDLGVTTRAYYDIRRFVDTTDVKIYNASRKTKLEAFERVTFEEALEQIEADRKR